MSGPDPEPDTQLACISASVNSISPAWHRAEAPRHVHVVWSILSPPQKWTSQTCKPYLLKGHHVTSHVIGQRTDLTDSLAVTVLLKNPGAEVSLHSAHSRLLSTVTQNSPYGPCHEISLPCARPASVLALCSLARLLRELSLDAGICKLASLLTPQHTAWEHLHLLGQATTTRPQSSAESSFCHASSRCNMNLALNGHAAHSRNDAHTHPR